MNSFILERITEEIEEEVARLIDRNCKTATAGNKETKRKE